MSTTQQSRQPAGVPAGGQFASSTHAEADSVALDAPAVPRAVVRPTKGVSYEVTYLRTPDGDDPYPVTTTIVAGDPDPDGVWLRSADGSETRRIDTITRFEPTSKVLARRKSELARELFETHRALRSQILDHMRADLASSFSEVERIEFRLEDESDWPIDVYAIGTGTDGKPKTMAVGGGHAWHTGPHMAVHDLLSDWPDDYDDGSDHRCFALDMAQRRIVPDER